MKKLIFLLLCLIVSATAFAQSSTQWLLEGLNFQLDEEYDKALPCLEKALEGFRDEGDNANELKVLCYIGDAKLFKSEPDVMGALDAYQQADKVATALNNSAALMTILREERLLYEYLGHIGHAQRVTRRMDSLAVKSEDDLAKFEYCIDKGDEALNQEDYGLAKYWYCLNNGFISALDDNYHDERATYWEKLGNLYSKLNDYEKALEYKWLTISEFKKNEKMACLGYFTYLDLARVYIEKGDSLSSQQCLDSALVQIEVLDSPKDKARWFNTKAECLSRMNRYDEALENYKRAGELLLVGYGRENDERLLLLAAMGGVEHHLGHYNESERLYYSYAYGIKKLQGENSADYIDALIYLANAEGFAGHIDKACGDFSVAVNKLKHQMRNRIPYMASAKRESYWKPVSQIIQRMTSFALKAGEFQSAFTESCYDGLVLSKAFLLETERSVSDLVKQYGIEEDWNNYRAIASMQAQIIEWEKDEVDNIDSIAMLDQKMNQLETQLADRCRAFGDVTAFMDIDYRKIKRNIIQGEVLVDFTDFISESRGRVYAVYVVNSSQDYPLLKELFEENMLDSLKMAYPDQYYDTLFSYAKQLYEMVWEPIEEYVSEGATVYYVPTQFLFQLALESLPAKDGKLLGEHYHFVRLSSARELVAFGKREPLDLTSGENNVVLYGGLQYSLDTNVMAVESKRYDVSHLLAYQRDLLQGDSLNDLPGTKDEVDSIVKILKSYGVLAKAYMGKEGTEESFLNLNGQAPKILHVATHGFYFTPEEALEIDYLRGYKDAMSLSGLVMSGGNAEWLGKDLPEGVLGGILTASEIARLDLSGVDLLVLSACNTGRGAVTSEGLYGLQRAFKKAGVKTMVMSLWEVKDFIGPEFMTAFYGNLLRDSNEMNVRKAFEDAKIQLRKEYPKVPYYWAVFVLLD